MLGFARFYDSINQMLPSDRPDDAVIEDDEQLDRWYDSYLRETAKKLGKKVVQDDTITIPEFVGG